MGVGSGSQQAFFWQMPKLHQKVPEECGGQDGQTGSQTSGQTLRQTLTERVKKLTDGDDEQRWLRQMNEMPERVRCLQVVCINV